MPILHHYPPSLFSEKVRVLFGYLDLEWQSVIIPAIMPRPDLMPLSGGYRKTPIMQIGANVYCDTEVICRKLAELAGDSTLYAQGFTADRVARWADTELFKTTVALNFRPEAVMAQMSQMSAEEVAAFQKDRAELSAGAPLVALDPLAAQADFIGLLTQLDASLSQGYLFGVEPCIADFSLYHCLWFVAGNEANAKLFEPFDGVRAYMKKIAKFGHGTFHDLPSAQALAEGTQAEPVEPQSAVVVPEIAGSFVKGDSVAVAPNDYGRIPVAGRLIKWTHDEVVIERNDDHAGRLMVHFPNSGFEVTAGQ
ncbi:MAG: glutathione S-transferase family protein [Pseudomonadota bacterium]